MVTGGDKIMGHWTRKLDNMVTIKADNNREAWGQKISIDTKDQFPFTQGSPLAGGSRSLSLVVLSLRLWNSSTPGISLGCSAMVEGLLLLVSPALWRHLSTSRK